MYQFLLLLLATTASANMEGFIVGGDYTSIRAWPFITMVYIQKKHPSGGGLGATCGGSLISSQTVLTAAHCTDDMTDKHKNFDKFTFTIFMGNSEYTKSTMIRKVRDYISHHQYDPNDSEVHRDISLMFLESPVKFSNNIKKVILVPPNSVVHKGMKVEVAGWGMTDMYGAGSERLKSVVQKMITTQECRKSIGPRVIGVVCAGSDAAFAYRGDSGGPLVRKSDHYQIGIVSFRAIQGGVTVYTSVAYYHDWIKNSQKKLFQKYCPHTHRHHKDDY